MTAAELIAECKRHGQAVVYDPATGRTAAKPFRPGAKMPPPLVTQLNDAVRHIKQTPQVKQQFATLGAISIDM